MSPSEKIGITNLFCMLSSVYTFSNTLVLSMKQTPFLSKSSLHANSYPREQALLKSLQKGMVLYRSSSEI